MARLSADTWTLVLAATLALVPPAFGQSGAPMTEARLRALARQAQREARGDATELVLALDRHVREAWGEFESFPVSIVRREDLLVALATPYMAFRRSIVNVLTTKRRIEDAVWVETAVVSIAPARLESPDIESVVLTRNGQEVPPVRNGLKPMTFANGSGGSAVLHAGDVQFPARAFAPGVPVTLTLRLRGGDPIAYEFTQEELAILK